MRRHAMLAFAASLITITAIAEARPGDRIRERIAERRGGDGDTGIGDISGRADHSGTPISYGSDKVQRIQLWPAKPGPGGKKPPLAIFVHGGGWQKGYPELVDNKPAFFKAQGWAFASVGYRLLPDSPVEEQARDVGRAIAKLRSEAERYGYDPDRILLFGHSAGAHLTALVSSDPQYAGDSFGAIKGTILIDGACYDVPAQIEASPFMAKRTYIPAFSDDVARQRALSPLTHVGGRDVGDWLILYTSARDDAELQSKGLGAALQRGRTRVELFEVPSTSRNPMKGHMEINRDFGTPGYAATGVIEAIMRRVSG